MLFADELATATYSCNRTAWLLGTHFACHIGFDVHAALDESDGIRKKFDYV
jgi:hypothetical protein